MVLSKAEKKEFQLLAEENKILHWLIEMEHEFNSEVDKMITRKRQLMKRRTELGKQMSNEGLGQTKRGIATLRSKEDLIKAALRVDRSIIATEVNLARKAGLIKVKLNKLIKDEKIEKRLEKHIADWEERSIP